MGATTASESLSAALFPKARRAILALLYGRPQESFYLRQLARASGAGQGAVQRELRRLSDAGVVVRTARGRQVFYQANPRCPIYTELRSLLAKTAGLAEVLRRCLDPLQKHLDLAFVFGSQASGRATPTSDVDVLVVGDVDEMALHRAFRKAEAELGRAVNYTYLDRSEFRNRRRQASGFLAQVVKGPKIPILGDADEV